MLSPRNNPPEDPMYIVVCGRPLSGKGTHSRRLAEERGMTNLSTGAMLREEVARETVFGKKYREIEKRGGLAPDDFVNSLVEAHLDTLDATEGVVFDGYPRTLTQAKMLDYFLRKRGRQVDLVVHLAISEKTAFMRMQKRAIEQRRLDDTPEGLVERLSSYQMHVVKVLRWYRATSRVVKLNAEGAKEDVARAIDQAIERRYSPGKTVW